MAEGGSWIAKYGLPSVIVSLALFGLQQQQQTFDRLQANTEGGWQFYSQNRTSLLYSTDIDRELSLLDIIGRAFPSVYCDVRLDISTRAGKAGPRDGAELGPDGRPPIGFDELRSFRETLGAPALDRPRARQLPQNAFEAWMPKPAPDNLGRRGAACPDLNAPETVVASADDATNAAAPADAEVAAPPPPAPPPMGASVSSTAPTRSTRGRDEQPSLAAAPAQTTPPTAPRQLRIFVHVVANGPRESEVLGIMEGAGGDLTNANFRVVRGIARIPQGSFARDPVVRYFGAEERDTAEKLAAYLSYLYRGQNLRFQARAIGDQYPNMPHDNLEVWIPNPR